jgi:predicted nucleic acid-binding protein
MARSPRRQRKVYWDACSWIAQISNQKVLLPDGSIEDRGSLCRAVVVDAEKGATEIFTSALSLAEVSKLPSDPLGAGDKIKEFFENDFIVIVQLDRRTGELARDLMQIGYPGLKPLDAVHLASASVANVAEMHTFDGKLLRLDEKIMKADGLPLKICKPSMGGPPLPLLDAPPSEEINESGEETEQGGALSIEVSHPVTAENREAEMPRVQDNGVSDAEEADHSQSDDAPDNTSLEKIDTDAIEGLASAENDAPGVQQTKESTQAPDPIAKQKP